jgi:S-adenosylmethionine/arginine decarboxylase-like enzyme
VESLGYGTQLILDGFNADPERLQDEGIVNACLSEVGALLEPTQSEILSVIETSGLSAVLRLTESHLSLHTYSQLGHLSLHIFSRHDLRPSEVTDLLTNHFGVRRVESFLSNHSRTMPQDSEARRRVLRGDRAYSALRLDTAL